MERDWLTTRTTVEGAESAHAVKDDRLGSELVPFGFQNHRWKELVSVMQPGDELWEFKSPAWTWANMSGRAGVALVRQGDVIASIVTRMN